MKELADSRGNYKVTNEMVENEASVNCVLSLFRHDFVLPRCNPIIILAVLRQFCPDAAHARSLSGGAVKVYVELRSRFKGNINGDLSLSWEECKHLLHIGKTTAGRAFDELEDKGFIAKMKLGNWYGRRATTWAVSDPARSASEGVPLRADAPLPLPGAPG